MNYIYFNRPFTLPADSPLRLFRTAKDRCNRGKMIIKRGSEHLFFRGCRTFLLCCQPREKSVTKPNSTVKKLQQIVCLCHASWPAFADTQSETDFIYSSSTSEHKMPNLTPTSYVNGVLHVIVRATGNNSLISISFFH